jgi:hypothetical protein
MRCRVPAVTTWVRYTASLEGGRIRPAMEKSATLRMRRNYITRLLRRLQPSHEPHEAADIQPDVVAVDDTRTVVQDPLVRHFVENMRTYIPRGRGLAPPLRESGRLRRLRGYQVRAEYR